MVSHEFLFESHWTLNKQMINFRWNFLWFGWLGTFFLECVAQTAILSDATDKIDQTTVANTTEIFRFILFFLFLNSWNFFIFKMKKLNIEHWNGFSNYRKSNLEYPIVVCRLTDIWKKANSKRSNFNQLRWIFFWFHFAFFKFQFKFSIKIISVGRRLHFRLKLKIKNCQELDSDIPFKQTLWSFYFILFCLKMILECFMLHIEFNFIRKKMIRVGKRFKTI